MILTLLYLSLQTSSIFLSLKKGKSTSNSKEHTTESSGLHTTLDHLVRSCLSATPEVEPTSLTSSLSLCTTLSDEAIQGLVAGYESLAGVDLGEEEHTSHVSKILLNSVSGVSIREGRFACCLLYECF